MGYFFNFPHLSNYDRIFLEVSKMAQYSILLVEDEASIRKFIEINLKREGFVVHNAGSGEEALELAKDKKPDVIVLDVMLPGIDGFETCRRLREKYSAMAIIMLTARGLDMDKIMGLELGADDYLIKPFNPLELIARIRAVLRRTKIKAASEKDYLECGHISIDLTSKRAFKSKEELNLTPKEFNILRIFLENQNTAFSRDELLNAVWGEDFVGDPKTVDVHVRRLREKIEDNPAEPQWIETVWGVGYRWKEGKSNERH